ncbi:MAG: CBS domain-containing protein [Eubacteriales bacterium]
MKAKNIMTKQIITVKKDDTVSVAAQKMQQTGVGTVAVEDAGKILGIITDRDIVVRNVATNQTASQIKCGDIMTKNVATASPDATVDEVAQIMSTRQIKRVPIVDQNKIVGMIALSDISQARGKKGEAGTTLRNITEKQQPLT